MTALIDGDIVAYRAAASSEGDPVQIAILRCDGIMRGILDKESDFLCFLTGSQTKYPFIETPNFRNLILLDYKSHRRGDPRHLDDCRKFLIDEYKAQITVGYEADDALGFHQNEESVIYSVDKDLLQIPGSHFNFVKNEYQEVEEIDGIRHFYKQMLIGDTTDHIFGIDKIGKVKAGKLLDHITDEDEMFNIVAGLYDLHDTDELGSVRAHERFWSNADCLWIWRKENETYSDRMRVFRSSKGSIQEKGT